MSKRILIALSALFAAGCFFGGEEDSPLPIVPDPKPNDSVPKIRPIVPGLYVGDYSWIDSTLTGFESEFLLDTNGAYRHFWVFDNEAFYDQGGAWIQKDSSFLFSQSKGNQVNDGLSQFPTEMEDDTNSIRNVTDTSFTYREWTPLRQKPYWISYRRVSYPKLREGVYTLTKTFGTDSSKLIYDFKVELMSGKLTMTLDLDSLPYFQTEGKYFQSGSFLITDENRQREADSTQAYSDWLAFDGAILQRLQTISDTAFTMWSPSQSMFEPGNWDLYRRKSPSE